MDARATAFLEKYQERSDSSALTLEIRDGESAIGGGAGPNTHPATSLIAINHPSRSAEYLAEALRLAKPPIISRIADGKVVIDLRTVEPREEPEIIEAILALAK